MHRPTRLAPTALAALTLIAFAEASYPQSFSQIVADANSVGMTLTNYGVIGNNFVSRSPSLEYPLGTGYEHLVRGGLWIGATTADASGPFTGVVTATLDAFQGGSTPPHTEYTPMTGILRLSNLTSSAFYSPLAISERDHITTFNDFTPRSTTANPETHRPMGIRVRQVNYSWAFTHPGLDNVLFHRVVISATAAPLTNVYVGLYTEMQSGPKNAYATWPPTSGGSIYGSWFGKAWLQYDAPHRLMREHRCAASPPPGACQLEVTPYWMGVKVLSEPQPGQNVTVSAWDWQPSSSDRDSDVERHALMSAVTIANLDAFVPGTVDPAELIALGPFSVAVGESIDVSFALVGGAEISDIQTNALLAQQTFDRGYLPPTATTVSLATADATTERVSLAWVSTSAAAQNAGVQRATERREWSAIGVVTPESGDRLTFEDRDVAPGSRYGYRLAIDDPETGAGTYGETWVDVPVTAAFALHGLRPNPTTGRDLTASFALPMAGAARIALYDLAGRRVHAREFAHLDAGHHLERLDTILAPGIYLMVLEHGSRRAAQRVAVVR